MELYADDLSPFQNDNWLEFLGEIGIRWPLKPGHTFSDQWLTRLVMFRCGTRFDLQITNIKKPDPSVHAFGYEVIFDKDQIFQMTEEKNVTPIPQPIADENEFKILVNDFLWDVTYIAKCLKGMRSCMRIS